MTKKLQTLKESYYTPTPKNWRVIGDNILMFSVVLEGYVMTLPFDDGVKLWVNAAIGFIGVVGKLLTNFKKDA